MDPRFHEELARCFFEDVRDALFVFDPATMAIVDANPMAQRLTRLRRSELLQMGLTDLIVSDSDRHADVLLRALKTTCTFHSHEEYALRRDDGSYLRVNLSLSRVHVRPKPLALLVLRDITERKRAEKELQRRDAILRAVSEAAETFLNDTAWRTALPGVLKNLGEAAGVDRVVVYEVAIVEDDRPVVELRHGWAAPDAPPLGAIPAMRSLPLDATGLARWTDELRDGRAIVGPVRDLPEAEQSLLSPGESLSVAIVPLGTGTEWRGFMGFDVVKGETTWPSSVVDALKAAAATLASAIHRERFDGDMLQASRMEATATLAAGVAHDFNNLMVGVLINAELLATGTQLSSEEHEIVGEIQMAAERAGDLARQMLAYARGGSRHVTVVLLERMMCEVARLLRRTLEPNISLVQEIADGLRALEGDAAQLHQVVMNLVLNAAEAIEGPGRIVMKADDMAVTETNRPVGSRLAPGNYARLTVSDTGAGMDEATRTRAFEPFFSTKFQGRGLGLAAVYGIVRDHGGYIDIDSRVGEGTSVRVYLPTTDAEAEPASESVDPPRAASETVLIVDDEQVMRKSTGRLLEAMGYSVLTACDGEEASELVREHDGPIDVILLDVVMPRMDASGALPLLLEARPDTPVILCSGYGSTDLVESLLAGGAHSFLSKPFSKDSLVSTIRTALDGTPATPAEA
jgi:PAS domain S-box-containing protein